MVCDIIDRLEHNACERVIAELGKYEIEQNAKKIMSLSAPPFSPFFRYIWLTWSVDRILFKFMRMFPLMFSACNFFNGSILAVSNFANLL